MFRLDQGRLQSFVMRPGSAYRALWLLVAMMLVSCGKTADEPASPVVNAPPISAEQQRLEDFFAATWEADLARYPASASYLGIKDQQDQWNDVSESFQLESLELARQRLAFLEGIDTSQLSPARQLSYRLDLERTLAGAAFRHHRYVIHQFRGPHTSPISLLVNVHTIDSEQDAEDYIARLNNLPDYFDGVIEQIQIRINKGLYLVDWMIPQIMESAGNVLVGAPFDQSGSPSVIWADFNAKLDALKVEPAVTDQLREAGRQAMLTAVKPAYERLIAAVQSQQAVAPQEDGVWRFPDGDAFYASRLRDFTTTNLTPEAIHQAGLANVERSWLSWVKRASCLLFLIRFAMISLCVTATQRRVGRHTSTLPAPRSIGWRCGCPTILGCCRSRI